MSGRKDFLSQQAPENYVAGLGRGATGFTTRSDLGPAREGPSEDQIKEALAKRAQQLGTAPPTAYGAGKKKPDEEEDDERFRDAENEEGLFATGNYDRDDDEADRIYQSVDERMDKRRRARRLVIPFPSFTIPSPSRRPMFITLAARCGWTEYRLESSQGSSRKRAKRRIRTKQPQDPTTIRRPETSLGRRHR